jgi:hypothetical protein
MRHSFLRFHCASPSSVPSRRLPPRGPVPSRPRQTRRFTRDMWTLNNLKAGGPCLTPTRPAPPSLPSPAGRRRGGSARAPLVSVRASSGGMRKDDPVGGGDGDEAEIKASSSGNTRSRGYCLSRIAAIRGRKGWNRRTVSVWIIDCSLLVDSIR